MDRACRVHEDARLVTVEMGRVSFDSARGPVGDTLRGVLEERIEVELDGEVFTDAMPARSLAKR